MVTIASLIILNRHPRPASFVMSTRKAECQIGGSHSPRAGLSITRAKKPTDPDRASILLAFCRDLRRVAPFGRSALTGFGFAPRPYGLATHGSTASTRWILIMLNSHVVDAISFSQHLLSSEQQQGRSTHLEFRLVSSSCRLDREHADRS